MQIKDFLKSDLKFMRYTHECRKKKPNPKLCDHDHKYEFFKKKLSQTKYLMYSKSIDIKNINQTFLLCN